MVQIHENVREADVFVVQTAAPPLHQNIFELLIMIDALRSASAARVAEVIVTDTIPLPEEAQRLDKMRVLSVDKLLADAIRSIHDGTSVSALFQ